MIRRIPSDDEEMTAMMEQAKKSLDKICGPKVHCLLMLAVLDKDGGGAYHMSSCTLPPWIEKTLLEARLQHVEKILGEMVEDN